MSNIPTPSEIVEFRKSAGLTQKQCADKVGVTVRTWARIESGATPIKTKYWSALTASEAPAPAPARTASKPRLVRPITWCGLTVCEAWLVSLLRPVDHPGPASASDKERWERNDRSLVWHQRTIKKITEALEAGVWAHSGESDALLDLLRSRVCELEQLEQRKVDERIDVEDLASEYVNYLLPAILDGVADDEDWERFRLIMPMVEACRQDRPFEPVPLLRSTRRLRHVLESDEPWLDDIYVSWPFADPGHRILLLGWVNGPRGRELWEKVRALI